MSDNNVKIYNYSEMNDKVKHAAELARTRLTNDYNIFINAAVAIPTISLVFMDELRKLLDGEAINVKGLTLMTMGQLENIDPNAHLEFTDEQKNKMRQMKEEYYQKLNQKNKED